MFLRAASVRDLLLICLSCLFVWFFFFTDICLFAFFLVFFFFSETAPDGRYPGGLRQVLSELLAKEGPGALYKGLAPAIVRAFPANAACFLGVETSKKVLDNYL